MPHAGPKLLTQIAAVHFVSHVHIMLIPALLPVLPGLLGVGFVELGVALAVFNIVSALVQAPLGYAVDHYGARKVLKAGLLLGSLSFLLLAVSPGYAVLLVTMAMAGLANGVYHPADYALLANGIEQGRLGRSFSIHTFAGFLGSAVTPAVFLGIAAAFGTQAALAAGAVMGVAALLLISVPGSGVYQVPRHGRTSGAGAAAAPGRVRLLTPMIGVLTVLFILLNLSTSAIEKFSVAALVQGQGLTLAWANTALTAFLLCSAVGVLCGGALADRTRRHGLCPGGGADDAGGAGAGAGLGIGGGARGHRLADRGHRAIAGHAGQGSSTTWCRGQNLRAGLDRLQYRRRHRADCVRLDARPAPA